MYLTNLYGKQVFALYEGEVVGTIANATFNDKLTKIISFKIFDNEENEFELKTSQIRAFNDCFIISNTSKLLPFIEFNKVNPIFKNVIDSSANFIGKIIDCEIDERFNILNFKTDKRINLLPANIYLRKNFVYYTENKFNAGSVKILKKNPLLEEIKVKKLNLSNSAENFTPTKVQINTNSMIGRVVKDSLFGLNNEIIIKNNQVVTEKIIKEAIKHNRLNQLYFLLR